MKKRETSRIVHNKQNSKTECLICGGLLSKKELKEMITEFKDYPAHMECFDEFYNADSFLKEAKKIKEEKQRRIK